MADNSVFITGAADGALNNALSGMPPWATEKTLFEIFGILKNTYDLDQKILDKLGKGGGGGLTAEDALTVSKALKNIEEHRKKEEKEEKKRETEKKKRWDRELFYGKKAEGRYAILIGQLELLKSISDKVVNTLKQNVDTFAQLQQSGINVASGMDGLRNGFEGLQQITALSNVRYTELAATMQKYSTAVNAFTAGKFAKSVGLATNNLLQFGFSSKESAELLGSYLESQAGYTDIQNRSAEETAQNLQVFAKGLSRASMATGMAKNAILANMEAISKSSEASVLSGQVGDQAATATLEFISSMKDQNLGRAFLKMMTDQIKPLNQTFMSFQKIGLGNFGQKLINFVELTKTMKPEQAAQAIREFEKQNRAEIEAAKKRANLFSQMPELAGEAQATLSILAGLQQQANTTKELKADEIKQMEESNEARSRLTSSIENLKSTFQSAFGNFNWVINGLAIGFDLLAEGIKFMTSVVNLGGRLGTAGSSMLGMFIAIQGVMASFVLGIRTLSFALSKVGMALPARLMSIQNTISKFLINPFKLVGSIFSKLFSGVRFIAANIGSIGGFLLRLAKPFALISSFFAGWDIGTRLSKILSNFDWFNNMMDTIFKGIDKVLQYIPGSVGSGAKERLEARSKADALAGNAKSNSSEISVPKSPAPSTISSPSANTNVVSNENKSEPTPVAMQSMEPTAPGKEKSSSDKDINSAMAAHNSLLSQILDVLHNTASTNKDILRYTKTQA